MDFGLLLPEVNSGPMYYGPGSGPMLPAAAGWGAVAAELESTASGYSSAVSGPTGQAWPGPASMTMAAVAAPYVTRLQTSAAAAQQTAGGLCGGVHDDGAPAGDRGQPGAVNGVDRDQFFRAEHLGDYGHRSPTYGDVGPRRSTAMTYSIVVSSPCNNS